ncbi:MAG TPA: hypothetical protein VGF99_12200 [Myxococcota bacterium]
MAGNATAIFNIVLGAACIVGGATGRLALFGTNSGMALAVAGSVAVGLGVFQLWRRNGRR